MKSHNTRSIIVSFKKWLASIKKKRSLSKKNRNQNNKLLMEQQHLSRDACEIKVNKRS